MKVYTTGLHGHLSMRIRDALGLPRHISQGNILVAAKTKAQAYQLLAERRMEPGSIRDPEFRQAMGNNMDELARVGLLDVPIVLAMGMDARTKVIRVEPDTTVLLGDLEPAAGYKVRFVPAPAGVDGPVPAEPMPIPDLVKTIASRFRIEHADAMDLLDDAVRSARAAGRPVLDKLNRVHPDAVPGLLTDIEAELEQRDLREESQQITASKTTTAEMVVMALAENKKQVAAVNDELKRLRAERQEFAHRARELDVIAEAALALGVTPARVSQLGDEYLVALARERNEFRPGVWVELEDPDRGPDRYARAQVVQQPADMPAPDDTDSWVWVHTNGNTFPVRRHRVLAWTPPCSACPPEEQLTIRSSALTVHQAARHR